MSKDQDYKQSIQVTIRVRPPNEKQINEDSKICIKVQKQYKSLTITNNNETKTFAFDSICDYDENQEDIFYKVGLNSTKRCLEGYNCSIFAYGQTGAGKTFTMMGINYEHHSSFEKRGLIPRTLQFLFQSIQNEIKQNRSQYLIKCTFLEIYNQQIIDLLNKTNCNLQIREDLKKGVYVEGIQEQVISRTQQAMEILKKGSKGRHVGSTFYNQTSSRSHSVFSMLLQSKTTKNGIINMKSRRFHFIDLAGSQRTKLSNGQRLKQGCSINKSLHVLGMVINSLVESTESKPRFINYRDSKLTFLLKDALGGNSKTHLIANVSPISLSYPQTLSTLTFARRVKLIKLNKVLINEDASGNLQALKGEIRRLKQEIVKIKSFPNITQSNEQNEIQKTEIIIKKISDKKHIVKQKALEKILLKNQSKINLQKLLQEYIQESIEKQAKFELQLIKKQEKLNYLTEGLNEFSKNQIHLRMIIKIYDEKFKRMKILQNQLIEMIQKLDDNDKSKIVNYVQSQRQILHNEIEQYKQLLNQTPFLKELIKQNNIFIDEDKPEENILGQLNKNLSFLKQIKDKLDYNIQERNQLNQFIENYYINKEEQILPQKKIVEQQNHMHQKYLEDIQRYESQVEYLKGLIQQAQLLLKQSVDKELTLEQEIVLKNQTISQLKFRLKQTEQRESLKYSKLLKSKEQTQIQLYEKVNKVSLENLHLNQRLNQQINQINQLKNKIKKVEQQNRDQIQKNQYMCEQMIENQLQLDRLKQQKQKYKANLKAITDRSNEIEKQLQERNQTIRELNQTLKKTNKQNQQLSICLQNQKSLSVFCQNQLKQIQLGHSTQKINLQNQIYLLKNEASSANTKIQDLYNTINKLNQHIQSQRLIMNARDKQFKQLLLIKETSGSELQNQVDKFKYQIIILSEKVQQKQLQLKKLKQYFDQQTNATKIEYQKQLQLKNNEINNFNEQLFCLKNKEIVMMQQKQCMIQATRKIENQLKQSTEKIKIMQLKDKNIQKSKFIEQQLRQKNSLLEKQIEKNHETNNQIQQMVKQMSNNIYVLKNVLNSKEKIIEKLKDNNIRQRKDLEAQLELIKQQNFSHQTFMKKVFEECVNNKQKAISDLKNQAINLELELKKQIQKLQQKNLKIIQLQSNQKEILKKLQEKEQILQSCQQESQNVKNELQHLRDNFDSKIEQRENNYIRFIDQTNQKLDQSQVELEKVTQLYNNLLRTIQQKQYLISINTSEINLLHEKINSLNEKYENWISCEQFSNIFSDHLNKQQILDHINLLMREYQMKQQKISEIKEQNIRLMEQKENQIEKLQKQIEINTMIESQLKNLYGGSSIKIKELQKQLIEKNKTESTLNEKIRRLMDDNELSESKIIILPENQNMVMINQSNKSSRFSLSRSGIQKEKSLYNGNKEQKNQQQTTNKLKASIHQLNLQVEIKNQQYQNLKQSNNKIINNLREEIVQCQRQLNDEHNTISCLEHEINTINMKYEIQNSEQLKKQFEISKSEYEKQLLLKNEKINYYQSQIKKLNQLIRQSTQVNQQLLNQNIKSKSLQVSTVFSIAVCPQHQTNQIVDNQQEITYLKRYNHQLLTQLEQICTQQYTKNIQINTLEIQNSHLKTKNFELSNQIQNYKSTLKQRQQSKNYQIDSKRIQQLELYNQYKSRYEHMVKQITDQNILIQQLETELRVEKREFQQIKGLLQKTKQEICQYKHTNNQNRRIIKQLKLEMNQRQKNMVDIQNKGEELRKKQDKKIQELKQDYIDLQNQKQILLRERQSLNSIKEENQKIKKQLIQYKTYKSNLQQTITQLESNIELLKRQYQTSQQIITRLKEDNASLRKQQTNLKEKLQNQLQDKKNLKLQLSIVQKKGNKISFLDNFAQNFQSTLKMELQRKSTQIKYLQQGFAQLCMLLGIKRLPQNKAKGESTKRLIMLAVEQNLRQLNETKAKLKQKQQQIDNKSIKMEIVNKEYTELLNKFNEARSLKNSQNTSSNSSQTKTEDIYSKRLPLKSQNNYIKSPFKDSSYKLNQDNISEQPRNRIREINKRRYN